MTHSGADPLEQDIAIDITVEHAAWNGVEDLPGLARRAIDAARLACGDVMPAGSEVSILLCDDAFIADLNRKWRGIDKPTNVLSFPTDADSGALGDIVVAYETVIREAADDHKNIRDHLCHMIVHGFFHLLGFDHEDTEEAEAMEAMEIRALATLGIASPYETDLVEAAEDRRPPR